MVLGEVLENKLVAVSTEFQNYYCYNWVLKFSCTCRSCFRDRYSVSYSSLFTTPAILSHEWLLILNMNDAEKIKFSFLYKNLTPIDIDDNIFNSYLKLSVKNSNYTSTYQSLGQLRDRLVDRRRKVCLLNLDQFSINYNDIPNFEITGQLTITVEIFKLAEVMLPMVLIAADHAATNAMTNGEKVSINNLQRTDLFSDVTLVVGEREFPAHKIILAAHSSVFLAMFERDRMKEKAENVVIIEDVSDEVIELVLNYMYSGSVDKEQLKDVAIDVLVAANKYALESLVNICEDVLIQGLNRDNVFKVLKTGDTYKLDVVKKAAMDFIVPRIKDLVETDEFDNLGSMHLSKEIMLAVLEQLT